MEVIWEREDLVEVILSLRPAVCDIVSQSGEHLVLPILDFDKVAEEAISSQITNFFIKNPLSSVLIASSTEPDTLRIIDMFKGFWVSSTELFNTNRLSFRKIPKELIRKEIRNLYGNAQLK